MKSPTNYKGSQLPRLPMAIVCISASMLLIMGAAIAPPSPGLTGSASWIWHPDALTAPDTHVYLTTVFDLDDEPLQAEYLCTADNEYTLYINGHEAGSSPGPGSLGNWWQRLDEHDVTDLLTVGDNTIAVRAYNVTGPAGFIGKLRIDLPGGRTLAISTDETWSATLIEPDGWPRSPDPQTCVAAASLGRPPVQPWGYPQPPTELSRIVTSLKTELKRTLVLPERIIETHGDVRIDGLDNILKDNGSIAKVELQEGDRVSIVLDFGRIVVGYFRARTSGGPAVLHLAYGESLHEALQAKPTQPIDRRVTEPDWDWTDHERRAFRFLKITVNETSSPFQIDYVGLDLVHYPVENRGSFRSSDDLLNEIWEVGRYTTMLCMQDFYEDGIKRDRQLWMGDLRVEALSGYYAFGDYKLAKRDLIRLADIQTAEGAIPAFGPTASTLILPDYCAYWVSGIWDYYLHSGDLETVELLYPSIERQMYWFTRQLNSHSLVRDADRKEWWTFIDWGDIEKKDEVTALQAAYYHALTSASKLAEAVGDMEAAAEHIASARRVSGSANERLWLDAAGAYADCRTPRGISERITQQSNALAVLFGIADPSRWESIHSVIFDRSRVQPTTTPYMNFYVTKALYRMNRQQEALDLIRGYWGEMVRRGATTYWEAFDPEKPSDFVPDSVMSLCHGWSAGVTSILPAEVVGIKPLTPGFAETAIIPRLADLEWAEARVPTPRGEVFASWRKTSVGIRGDFEIAVTIETLIGIPVDKESLISLNGKIVWERGKTPGFAQSGASAAWRDDRYVYLKLSAGGGYSVEAFILE